MKKIYLVDGNSFIYRMFFALPEFSTKSGKIVNATFGIAKFFLEQLKKENPDYLIFIKDAKGDNFRHKLYSDYKATRDRMPDNLRIQISDIEKMINLMGIDIIEIFGYEADDVIGTFAHKFDMDEKYEIDILTGDKDLYSLVSENVKIYDTMKKKKFGPTETREKFGVDSKMIIDYLAIVGDKSDNIPGIDGFGPQKAIELINSIGGVEDIFKVVSRFENGEKLEDILAGKDIKNLEKLFRGKTYEKLRDGKENAFLSKQLATLDKNVSLDNFKIENFSFRKDLLLNDKSIAFLKELEFFSLVGAEEKKLTNWEDLGLKIKIIGDLQGLKDLETIILNYKEIVLDTETTSLDVYKAELVGISIYLDDKNIYYVNLSHIGNKISNHDIKIFLENLLKKDDLTIIGHNLKYDLEVIELFLKNTKNQNYKENNFSQLNLQI